MLSLCVFVLARWADMGGGVEGKGGGSDLGRIVWRRRKGKEMVKVRMEFRRRV